MKTVYFITGNQGKIDNLNLFLHELTNDISFEMLKLDFEELKNDYSMEKTALNKAITCHEMTGKDVVVSDVGIFIEALNGFPGVNTGFAIQTIGNSGILKLMEDKTNRNAYFQVSYAYVNEKGTKKVFTAKSDIEIATSEDGELGFDWDKIVTGNKERFSNNIKNEKRIFPYKDALRQFVEFLKNE